MVYWEIRNKLLRALRPFGIALATAEKRIIRNAHVIYIAITLPMVFFLATVQRPFSAPDEIAHFARAYSLSTLKVLPNKTPDGFVGGYIDEAMLSLKLWPTLASRTKPYGKTEIAEYHSVQWSKRELLAATNAANYFPLVYLPQTLVVAVGRIITSRIYHTIFIGELLNGVLCVMLAAQAIRMAKFGKPLLFFFASLPMSLALFISFSPDGLMICSALLSIAYLTRSYVPTAMVDHRGISTSGWAIIAIAIVCIVATRVTYLPLAIIPLAIWATSRKTMLHSQQIHTATMFVVALAIVMAWTLVIAVGGRMMSPSGDVAAQMAFLRSNPLSILLIAIETYRTPGSYFNEMLGILGWLDIPLNPNFYDLAFMALAFGLASCSFENVRPNWLATSATIFGILGAIGLSFLAMYLFWTPPGNSVVEGFQGRYFLPIMPFVVFAVGGIARHLGKPRLLGLLSMLVIALADWLYTPSAVASFGIH